jgi:amidase
VFGVAMDATDLAYAGAAEQARLIATGEVTARAVVEATLDRIGEVDPYLRAYRVVFAEQALAEADAADARVAAGGRLPVMLGVPVAIKDDTDVAGEVTAWGGNAHGGPREHDSDVVAKLREAGAIVVGKTNVPELTIFPFTETLAFGASRNPWNRDHTPGGSSGGSGAAAAAGLCGVAQGSDGAGSIRIPAAFNGLFGLKTQRGTISLGPDHVDAWHGMAVYGPLARHVADAALFIDATSAGASDGRYVAAASAPPRPLRVAVSVKVPTGAIARVGADQLAAVQDVAASLRDLGHTVVEQELDYPLAAFRGVLVRYLRGIHDDAVKVDRPRNLEPRTKGMSRLGGLIPASQVTKARAGEAEVTKRINAIFDDVDVVLTPGPTGPPFRVGELHGRGALWTLNAVAARVPFYGVFNATGQPAASVPAGFDAAGLPLAVQLVGREGDETTLLALGAQLEGLRRWADRRPGL